MVVQRRVAQVGEQGGGSVVRMRADPAGVPAIARMSGPSCRGGARYHGIAALWHLRFVVQLASDDVKDASCLADAIERELPGLVTSTGSGDWFLFYDPHGVTVPEKRFPFCTLVTGDRYDSASRLDRDATTYRVNLGVDRPTYESLFGPAPRQPAGTEVIDTGFDYTTTDTVMPHPYYAPLHWVCVVSPVQRTRGRLASLLDRAHLLAKTRYDNRYQG